MLAESNQRSLPHDKGCKALKAASNLFTMSHLHVVSVRKEELTLDRFRQIWSSHTPLVVRGVHLDFQISWTPEYFIQRYGQQTCEVEDCETRAVLPDYTVRKFFERFGQQHAPDDVILRLKVSYSRAPMSD